MTEPLTLQERSFLKTLLEKKLVEKWAELILDDFVKSKLNDPSHVFPKFGSDGKFYFKESTKAATSDKVYKIPNLERPAYSLPDMMIRDEKTISYFINQSKDSLKIKPHDHFIRKEAIEDKERGIDVSAFQAYLTFIGITKEDFKREFTALTKHANGNGTSIPREKGGGTIPAWAKKYSTITVLGLILLSVLWFLLFKAGCQKEPVKETYVPNDPLGIVGYWNYEVKPSRTATKLYGYVDEEKDSIALLYYSWSGYVKIEPIKNGDTEYNMTGERTEMVKINRDTSRVALGLKFPYVFPNPKKEELFFRFEVTDDENSHGFVILSEINVNSEPPKMSGIIFYLYQNQEWHEANIFFKKSSGNTATSSK